MNSVPKTDASAPATIDFHFIEPLSPTQPALLSSALVARPRADAPSAQRLASSRSSALSSLLRCLRAAGGCQRTPYLDHRARSRALRRGLSLRPRGPWRPHSIRQIGQWLLTANHSRASTGTAIPGTPACDGTLSNTWQPLQSKVCKVD